MERTDVMSLSLDSVAEKTFDNFKKITPALVAVTILTGLILFLPEKVLEKMSLNNLPDVWKQIIGIAFILSLALIATIVFSSIFSTMASKRKAKKFKKNQRSNIKKLSPNQKAILRKMLHSKDKAIKLDSNSGDTIYLQNGLYIYRPEQAFSLGWENEMILVYVPYPWLIDLFNEEPELFN